MAKKSHPYWEPLKISALIFVATILIIVFLALYVEAATKEERTIEPARAEQNIAPPGRLYSR